MILILLWLSFSTVYSIDKCLEFRTQLDCIQSTDSQCVWDSEYCQYTKNLELGCSNLLNKMACIKQLAYSSGQIAKCIFIKVCQPVYDLTQLTCTDTITKHSCLSIQNINQLCYWDEKTYTCNEIKEQTYQEDFENVLYSASVCGRIKHYLIIHSSLIWPLISYTPDFSSEAQDIYRQDLGLEKQSSNKEYDSGVLANNKLYNRCDDSNQATYFQWYHFNDAQSYALNNLKISDRKREGCIALQIADDNDYLQIFSTKIETIGINHIYCRYQGGVFTNYKCLYLNDKLELKDKNFLLANKIYCDQLNLNQCQYIEQECYPILMDGNNEQEITCTFSEQKLQEAQGCLSQTQQYKTYRDCASLTDINQGSYLDISQVPSICTSSCVSKVQDNCDTSICKWIDSQEDFYGCIPKFGCNQPGVNRHYCIYMAQPCQWDIDLNQCKQIQDYELSIIECNDAISKYLCGNIRTMGQECIWIDEDEKCLNVMSVPALKVFTAYPQKYIVNRTLCMNYKGKHIYQNFKCPIYTTSGSCATEDPTQFNKEMCLKTPKCHWDIMYQRCSQYQIKSSCEQMVSVSSDACSSFLDCIYDQASESCKAQSSNKNCNTPGLAKPKCLELENYPCQWIGGQCIQVTQFRELCTSYRNVSKLVCTSLETQLCQYSNGNCFLVDVQPTNCSDTYNRYACQYSTDQCYFFNNKCQSFTNQQISCVGYYVSKKACQAITTPGQECIWQSDQCIQINKRINCLASSSFAVNKWACMGIEAETSAYLDDQFYCEYNEVTKECKSNITNIIDDCGENMNINRQRCSGFTHGRFCLFQDYKCNQVNLNHKYWDDKLDTIKCEQANKSLCRFVRNRVCQWVWQLWAGYYDFRCAEVKIFNIQCSPNSNLETLSYQPLSYNPQQCSVLIHYGVIERCIPSTDPAQLYNNCIADNATPQNYYPCDQLGISPSICVTTTYGKCAYINDVCVQAPEYQATCSTLNKYACLSSRSFCSLMAGYTLNFDMGSLTSSQLVVQVCDQSTSNQSCESFKYDIQSWTFCSSLQKCYGRQKACKQLLDNEIPIIKCDSPGVSQYVCLRSNMICQFRNNRCQTISTNKCEFETTLEDCVQNLYYNCVYSDNKCYTQNLITKCDKYNYTNKKFCRQYPNCRYNPLTFKCVDFTILMDVQNNIVNYTIDCSTYKNQFDCLNQWKVQCQYQNNICSIPSTTPSSCPHLQQYSKLTCQKFENCDFKFGYYCYNKTLTIDCSQLSETLCVQDIDQNLECFWDGTTCQVITTQICSDIQNKKISYFGCQKVNQNDNSKCFYSDEQKLCKLVNEINQCSDFNTNIECALRAQTPCIVVSPNTDSSSCTTTSLTYNINMNQYGCTQLVGNVYIYDMYEYQCKLLIGKEIIGCENLNIDACIKSTSSYLTIMCAWINQRCQQINDFSNVNDCTKLNKYACMKIEKNDLICKWDDTNYCLSSTESSACQLLSPTIPIPIPNAIFGKADHPPRPYVKASAPYNSLSLCSKGESSKACMAKVGQQGCVEFNYTIEICSGLGLNKKACIEQTTGYCIWQNNQCQNASLDNQNCNAEVNKKTCLAMNDEMCKWNDTTHLCSNLTLLQCSDATSYNQCMNVPNKECQFINTCQELAILPLVCKKGYNKVACRNVKNQVCQFSNNECSLIGEFDFWQICPQYKTSSSCPTGTCQWQNSKCIINTECLSIKQQLTTPLDEIPYMLDVCPRIKLFACIQIYNKIGCMTSSLYCKWDDINGCSSFVTYLNTITCDETIKYNKKVCDKYAPKFCEFKEDSCSPKISDYYFNNIPTQTLASSEINQDIETETCDYYLTRETCIHSTKFACKWIGFCESINNNDINIIYSDLNLKACIKFNQQWRQRQCIQTNFLFIPNEVIDHNVQVCDTPFISKSTCLNISAQPCTFNQNNNKCEKTNNLSNNCSYYVNVNQKTCQLLKNSACQYNQLAYACVSVNTNQIPSNLDGVSFKACISLSIPVYWNNGCKQANIFQCDSVYPSSPSACALALGLCIYDQSKSLCVSTFNINSIYCDTPGISQELCTQIIRQPCIFKSNQCQLIPKTYSCSQAKLVNQQACASLNQSCVYDSLNKSCKAVIQPQKCSSLGLSKNACLLNPSCAFNYDYTQCQCSYIISPQICHNLNSTNCSQNSQCFYDTLLQVCRRKYCEDLSQQQCVGSLEGKQCYLSQGINCQSASKCEDIINVDESYCEDMFFDGFPCLGANKRCFSQNNFQDYCPNSDCTNNSCKYNQQNICQALTCSELDDCTKLGNYCLKLSNGQCIENNSCQSLESDMCNGATVRTQASCLLQKYNLYLEDVICTSQVCELYGISDLCNGNEYNGYTCLLVDQKCIPCEQILDVCTCMEATGICLWKNNQCHSVQCNELLNAPSCNSLSRCSWSNLNNACMIHCNKVINSDECDSRTGECYFDYAINFCSAGVYQSPNLSIQIDISSIYSIYLTLSIITYILIL
ncbi:unnamed protein product [Paramecium pentaurelia]|uniref:Uncharacterized protein n=1 Tax=Paramecium pentaurelia TaxID=43138 RepID=A0A8S1SF80_9CILI|nr:unnamed protein product [Paramecium pentaurelia]